MTITIVHSAEVKAEQEAVLVILREKFKGLPEENAAMDGFGRIIGWHGNVDTLKEFAECASQCTSPMDFFKRICAVMNRYKHRTHQSSSGEFI